MERSIVVALDGSAFAERALPFATAIAERSGARLVLVRAAPDDDLVEAHDYLRGLAAPSRGIGGYGERPAVDTVAHPGVPAAVLLDEAHRRGAGLLVLATHGRSGLGRWRYGSVADAGIDVLADGAEVAELVADERQEDRRVTLGGGR
jgi:nucleotide-binding universal stress UspA family protein